MMQLLIGSHFYEGLDQPVDRLLYSLREFLALHFRHDLGFCGTSDKNCNRNKFLFVELEEKRDEYYF